MILNIDRCEQMLDNQEQEFEAAFREASGTPPEALAQQDDQTAAAEVAAPEGPDGGVGQAADPNSQTGAAPEPPTDAGTSTPDIWADAPEHLKTAYQAVANEKASLEHRLKSDEGRVSSYQRIANDLQRKISAIRTIGQQDDLGAYLKSEDFKKTKADYGDDLGPVFTALDYMANNLAVTQGRVGQVGSLTAETIGAEVETFLDEAAPDRADLLGSTQFIGWLEAQPKFIRDLASRNWDDVSDPAEVVELCDRFRAAQGLVKPGSTATETAPAKPSHRTEIDRKRELQLEGSKSSTSRQPITAAPDESDFGSAWKAAAAKQRRA